MTQKTKGKKKLFIFLTAIAVLIIAYVTMLLLPKPQSYKYENPFIKKGSSPLIFAHRGGADEFPENTLEAYYNATSLCPDAILETDVRLTKDEVLILLHDSTLDSTCNVTGNIKNFNYADLINNKIDFGYDNDTEDGRIIGELAPFTDKNGKRKKPTDVKYPDGIVARDSEVFLATTFEELLTSFPDNLISVEIKDEERPLETLHALIKLIEKHDAYDRVLVASFIRAVEKECRKMVKEGRASDRLMYTVSLENSVAFLVLQTLGLDSLYFSGAAAIHFPMDEFGFNLAKESLVKSANKHNIALHYFTIDNQEEIDALKDIGADGIMTDNPSLFAN